MRPDFALTLSFDGIGLLQRAQRGWRDLGFVSFSEPDVPAAIAELRQRAEEASGQDAPPVKLVLPDAQIRYIDVDGAVADDKVPALLEGKTPYALDDLAIDWAIDWGRTYVAAVASETLHEAETFALDHGFTPLSFVAAPDADTFPGEPFFGVAASAEDILPPNEVVETDAGPVTVLSDAAPSEPAGGDTQELAEQVAPAVPGATEPDDAEGPAAPAAAGPDDAEDAAEAAAVFASVRPAPKPGPTDPTPAFTSRRSDADSHEDDDAVAEDPAPKAGRIAEAPDLPPPPSPLRAPDTVPAASPAPVISPPRPAAPPPGDEAERLTIFGARRRGPAATSTPPNARRSSPGRMRTGLFLALGLLGLLATIAVYAALSPESAIARLVSPTTAEDPESRALASDPTGEEADDIADAQADPDPDFEANSAEEMQPEPGAPLIALRGPEQAPVTPEPQLLAEPAGPEPLPEPPAPDPAEIIARYAASGIWQAAPAQSPTPRSQALDDLYVTSIDAPSPTQDAVALPAPGPMLPDTMLAALPNPPPQGTRFDLDRAGRVRPTRDGALSPDGHLVFLGKPPAVPPVTPDRALQTPAEDEADREAIGALSAFRPSLRPENLAELGERATFGGLSRQELAAFRPALRPQGPQGPDTAPDQPVTEAALQTSLRPSSRPKGLKTQTAATSTAAAAATAPARIQPSVPSRANVAQEATVKNALNLRKINLIGVYGSASDRRALVRLQNGRYLKVKVGDRIDGGRVAAIGEAELRYTKNGRNLVLRMPQG